jgi:hypothetical protein
MPTDIYKQQDARQAAPFSPRKSAYDLQQWVSKTANLFRSLQEATGICHNGREWGYEGVPMALKAAVAARDAVIRVEALSPADREALDIPACQTYLREHGYQTVGGHRGDALLVCKGPCEGRFGFSEDGSHWTAAVEWARKREAGPTIEQCRADIEAAGWHVTEHPVERRVTIRRGREHADFVGMGIGGDVGEGAGLCCRAPGAGPGGTGAGAG